MLHSSEPNSLLKELVAGREEQGKAGKRWVRVLGREGSECLAKRCKKDRQG